LYSSSGKVTLKTEISLSVSSKNFARWPSSIKEDKAETEYTVYIYILNLYNNLLIQYIIDIVIKVIVLI